MFQKVHAMALPKQRPKEPERRYHHGDLRRALVDAALALIAEGSWDLLPPGGRAPGGP